jgi:hypothetical protein
MAHERNNKRHNLSRKLTRQGNETSTGVRVEKLRNRGSTGEKVKTQRKKSG